MTEKGERAQGNYRASGKNAALSNPAGFLLSGDGSNYPYSIIL